MPYLPQLTRAFYPEPLCCPPHGGLAFSWYPMCTQSARLDADLRNRGPPISYLGTQCQGHLCCLLSAPP